MKKMMKSQIISIGDELLMGDTINTNATWLGKILAEQGITVTKVHTIGDSAEYIRTSITEAMENSDLVITTGGLGPTHDDITKKTVADIFDADMIIHQPTLDFIKKVFKDRNIPFSKSNYYQAEVPDNCEVLFNKMGTAPGIWIEENDRILVVLPGIPHEVESLTEHEVLPRLARFTNGLEKTFSRHIKIAGIGESTISDELLGPLDELLTEKVSVAYLPSPQANTIRISTRAKTETEANSLNKDLVSYIYEKAGDYILGEGKSLSLSEALGSLLRDQSLSISIAESCTGGLLANTITDIPGSSDYMMGAIIAYANSVKHHQLNVDRSLLKKHGAVSKRVALQMAKAVAQQMETNIGVSTTGIAGPGGGSKDKPVGTVWIGFWSNNHHFALQTIFTNERLLNKERSVAVALETVRRTILDIEPMPYGLKPHYA